MPDPVLTRRALNRAALARQLLLDRVTLKVPAAVERIGGLQAQLARPPFIGLWSRLAGFSREDLAGAIDRREVVRGTLYRGTIHLVSRDDFLAFRPGVQGSLTEASDAIMKDRLDGMDLAAVLAAGRACFAERPRSFDAARKHLARAFPRGDERAMGYYVRMHLPLVQVPAAGAPWSFPSQADFTLADAWLGEPIPAQGRAEALALRYFGAFGPATGADFQSWSGLRAAPILQAVRSRLKVFRTEEGRELFDLPKAPRPDEDTPAPVRYLAQFDSLLLAYADRARIVPPEHKPALASKNLMVPGTFLVDGVVAGRWDITGTKKKAVLAVAPFGKLSRAAKDELAAEGERLLQFAEPDATTVAVTFGRA